MFFRAGTIEQAKKIGVVGHVENTSRGTVTGEVQGEPKPVASMKVWFARAFLILATISAATPGSCLALLQDWLQNKGPSGARIEKTSFSNEISNLDKLDYSSFEKH